MTLLIAMETVICNLYSATRLTTDSFQTKQLSSVCHAWFLEKCQRRRISKLRVSSAIIFALNAMLHIVYYFLNQNRKICRICRTINFSVVEPPLNINFFCSNFFCHVFSLNGTKLGVQTVKKDEIIFFICLWTTLVVTCALEFMGQCRRTRSVWLVFEYIAYNLFNIFSYRNLFLLINWLIYNLIDCSRCVKLVRKLCWKSWRTDVYQKVTDNLLLCKMYLSTCYLYLLLYPTQAPLFNSGPVI